MRVYKRTPTSRFYTVDFELDGEEIRRSSGLTNFKEAKNWGHALRTRMIQEKAGLIPKERPKPPTLSEFKNIFNEWVKTDRPKSFLFYSGIYEILLECPAIKDLPLDEIREPQGEQMKFWALKRVSKTTVNRYIATLRKALRYACNTLHLIDKAPVIKQFPADEDVERQVTYVFTADDYKSWISAAEEPLRSCSVLARHCGICRGEMLALEKDCIAIKPEADEDGVWGILNIKRGLKRQARARKVRIDSEMKGVLETLMRLSQCCYVITDPGSDKRTAKPTKRLPPWILEDQIERVRAKIETHPDAGLHTLRHTFLTEAAEYTDPFTLQYVAGHKNIKTTMRYVHPQANAVDKLFGRLAQMRCGGDKNGYMEKSSKREN
jgi:integrase